jgi:hypothetical protein
MTDPQKTGFFSSFHTVDAVLASPPTYSLLVNDTDPILLLLLCVRLMLDIRHDRRR